MKRWVCGIDPGSSNLAFSFTLKDNPKIWYTDNRDVHIQGDKRIRFNSMQLHKVAELVVEKYHDFLVDCEEVNMEAFQTKKYNEEVKILGLLIHQYIKLKYPHIKIAFALPGKIRPFFGIKSGGSHAKNKKNVSEAKGLLTDKEMKEMDQTFGKDKNGKSRMHNAADALVISRWLAVESNRKSDKARYNESDYVVNPKRAKLTPQDYGCRRYVSKGYQAMFG